MTDIFPKIFFLLINYKRLLCLDIFIQLGNIGMQIVKILSPVHIPGQTLPTVPDCCFLLFHYLTRKLITLQAGAVKQIFPSLIS